MEAVTGHVITGSLLEYGALGLMLLVIIGLYIWQIKMHRRERKEWNAEASKKFTTIVELTGGVRETIKENTVVVRNLQTLIQSRG